MSCFQKIVVLTRDATSMDSNLFYGKRATWSWHQKEGIDTKDCVVQSKIFKSTKISISVTFSNVLIFRLPNLNHHRLAALWARLQRPELLSRRFVVFSWQNMSFRDTSYVSSKSCTGLLLIFLGSRGSFKVKMDASH